MKSIRRWEFERWARLPGPAMTIVLPLQSLNRESQGDALRLRKLRESAEDQLRRRGCEATTLKRILEPLDALVQSPSWNRGGKSLVVLATSEHFTSFKLNCELPAEAWGDDFLHLRPLLPLVVDSDQFFLLTISEKLVRLFAGDSEKLTDCSFADLPKNIDEALQIEDADRGLQVHAGSGMGSHRLGIFHGHGGKVDASKSRLEEFIRRIDVAVSKRLREHPAPLIVAAVSSTAAQWAKQTTCTQTLDEHIPGNPDHVSLSDLHAKAWELIRSRGESFGEGVYKRWRQARGTERALIGLDTILPAAHAARVDTLFLINGQAVVGRYDVAAERILEATAEDGAGTDLLELAIHQTVRHGGQIVPRRQLDSGARIEALLRY